MKIMRSTPQKISLIAQTEEVLLEGMKLKRWQHELPGERLLSGELRISRWTLRAALAHLAQKGFLKISHGLPCRITQRALRTRLRQPKSRRVALLSPTPLLRFFTVSWVDELRTILNERGILLSIYHDAKAYGPNPNYALDSLVAKHAHTDWVLIRSTQAMQEWFQARGLFVVIAGSGFEGIHMPVVDIACHATGVHAGHTVLGLGHRRVALFGNSAFTAGDLSIKAGLSAILSKAHDASVQFSVIACNEEANDICHAVDLSLAASARPSVVICLRSNFVATTVTHLLRLGLRVPQDVSLLSIDWEPYLDFLVPRISHYKISPVGFAMQIARALDTTRNPAPIYMTPQFIKGASLHRLPAESIERGAATTAD